MEATPRSASTQDGSAGDGPGVAAMALMRLAGYLPLPVLHFLGAIAGRAIALFPNRYRAVSRRNIELCFPDLTAAARDRLVRRSLAETGKTLLETLAIWHGPRDRLSGWARGVDGEALFEEAVAAGRGVIFAAPHLGSWEYLGTFLAERLPITNMFRPPRQRYMTEVMRAGRTRNGSKLVPTDASGIRALMQALRRGEGIGILPDQDPRENGTFAPFFGLDASTMTLLSKLAAKTGATVLFCFAERLPRGRGFRLHFVPAPEGVTDADPAVAAAAINRGVEACIERAPEQYQWSYQRFRTRPAGEPRRYPKPRRRKKACARAAGD